LAGDAVSNLRIRSANSGRRAEPDVLLLELLERACGSAPDGLTAADCLAGGDAGLRAGDGAVFELAMIGDADLSADYGALPYRAAAGNSSLRGDHGVLADLDIVSHLHEVIDFYSGGDLSGFERASIDCGVCADLHVVGNFDSADLRKFPVAAFAEDVTETVAADDCAGVNFDAIAESRAGVERDAGCKMAIRADV